MFTIKKRAALFLYEFYDFASLASQAFVETDQQQNITALTYKFNL